MKFAKIIATLFLAGTILASCEEDSTDGISFVTTYPEINLNGPAVIAIPIGGTFTETATATVGDSPVDLDIEGSVNSAEVGVYRITYTASNEDGYSASAGRSVVVYDPSTDEVDLSGQYIRNATGVTVTVTKVAPSTYFINDAAGYGSTFLDVYFIHTTGDELVIPLQVAPSSGIRVETVEGTGTITETGFQWQLNASSFYGTATRAFVKL